jgi:O-antigen ligase
MQGLGYYGNPNEFGKLMCTAIPFLGVLLFAGKGLVSRLFALGGIGTMITAVALTQSRTCFVVLGIIVVAPIIVSSRTGLAKRAILLLVLGVGFIYLFSALPGPLQDRMQSILEFGSDESFQGRIRAWGQGLQMVTWYPLYGVGKGQWYNFHGLAPHNSFVQIMAELGIPGIIVFCSIVWVSWKQLAGFASSSHSESERAMVVMAKGIAASYLGYLFYIFLGNQAYSPWTYFYFGLCAVFGHIVSTQADVEPSTNPERSPAGLEARRHEVADAGA